MADLNKILRVSHLRSGLIRLAGAVTEALEEMDAAKADKPSVVSATLPATGWNRDGSSAYPYYYDLAAAGVTAADIASVTVSPSGIGAAVACGLCPTNETIADAIRFRSYEAPTAAIAVEYEI
ncbi:MAG: hypothetical protein IJK52_13620, partial [Oscillospiraceae bacterium]|nr:hypothetical protein [Oscillospiraceae bacterium]